LFISGIPSDDFRKPLCELLGVFDVLLIANTKNMPTKNNNKIKSIELAIKNDVNGADIKIII